MGNNLVAYTPSQVLTVDQCLNDVNNYKYESSLGSTRFMKVARATNAQGWVVLKVFILPDANFDLQVHKQEITRLCERLKKSSNCLPFQTFHITDRAAVLVRQFVKQNLYDRLSTRPYYTTVDRKWVAFQLLCALNQMANSDVCHGDIKTENLLLTSWNWLLLTDFACYKPVELPVDNPAYFNYFYDTARRRSCYIAPERFSDSSSISKLTQASDIFSAGCVIAELFTDGRCLFDLSQLLAYKSEAYTPDLNSIQDKSIRDLVGDMIQLDPSKRKTAEQYLVDCERNNVFPKIYYSFLKKYVGKFCELPLKTADETIEMLYSDQKQIFNTLKLSKDSSSAVVVLASLLVSCIRKLIYCASKLKALHLVSKFVYYLADDFIMERIVPYVMAMLKNKMWRVRAYALAILASCLTTVSHIPHNEVGIFSEYIMPEVHPCASDEQVLVRQAYAQHISTIAQRALVFLNRLRSEQTTEDAGVGKVLVDFEIRQVINNVRSTIQVVMTDSESTCRLILLKSSITQLCDFFGRRVADDVVLSHMITVLNDKLNWQLRAAFFSTIVSVCTFIGWQSSLFLKPLLEQGLNDSEEFVVAETLQAVRDLVTLGLLPKQTMLELLGEHVAYLAHPCEWIRTNTIGLVSACASILTGVDNHCFLKPIIQPYLSRDVIAARDQQVVTAALKPHIRSDVYNIVCQSQPHLKTFFTNVRTREKFGKSSGGHAEDPDQLEVKLKAKEVSEDEERALLKLERHVIRRQQDMATAVKKKEKDGSVVDLGEVRVMRRYADLATEQQKKRKAAAGSKGGEGSVPEVSDEWRTMFGDIQTKPSSSTASSTTASNMTITMSQLESTTASSQEQQSSSVAQPPVVATNNPRYTKCMSDLRALVHHKRAHYTHKLNRRRLDELVYSQSRETSKSWRPQGVLVSRMTEHTGAINRLVVRGRHFVTASDDRTVKLWEAHERKMIVNRSRATCSHFAAAVRCMAPCGDDDIVCSSDDGALHHISLQRMSARAAEKPDFDHHHSPVMRKYVMDAAQQGAVTDLCSLFGTRLVVYLTTHGHIVAVDTRTWRPAYRLKQHSQHGLPTCMCADLGHSWLCVGTSHGVHVCWDVRFRLPVTTFSHPSRARVRRLLAHPTDSRAVVSAVNGNNELTVWNMETGQGELTLWGSNAPVFSLTHKSSDSVNGVDALPTADGLHLFTGGNDGRVRVWNCSQPQQCAVVCGGHERNNPQRYKITYESRLVDGTHVIQEYINKVKREAASASGGGGGSTDEDLHVKKRKVGEHNVPTHNRDVITDLALYNANQTMLVTSTSTGVVSLWK